MNPTAHSLLSAKLPQPLHSSPSLFPTFFHCKTHIPASHSVSFLCFRSYPTLLQDDKTKSKHMRSFGAIHASEAESPSAVDPDRWLLEPAGDGDSRHLGFKIPMPNAFEIASSVVTVGRLPEKADKVIPVATVSGLHARIQKKEGSLLITDLDSTNGTFVDDKRLRPGAVTTVSPGSLITFGDTHLATFRVSKLQNVGVTSKPEESEDRPETSRPSSNLESTS